MKGQGPVVLIVGTRPEAIKMAPIARALGDDAYVVSTGQHRDLLAQMAPRLGLRIDCDLDVMCPGQSLSDLSAAILQRLPSVLRDVAPRIVLVQGDTTSAMAAALCSFYEGIPVGHVEAGLRSGSLHDPFPEEMNRRTIGQIATWHFAPTDAALANLRASDVQGEVLVTGNTVIDNLNWVVAHEHGRPAFRSPRKRILVTMHRRESQGARMTLLAEALARIADRDDVELVLPMHPSPAVRQSLQPLWGHPRVQLIEPLDYFDFVATVRAATLIVTDSGGVQEEAPTFGVPVLVVRETTERQEAVDAGVAQLVGTEPGSLISSVLRLLDDSDAYARMSGGANPFGDGHAAERIVDAIASDVSQSQRSA